MGDGKRASALNLVLAEVTALKRKVAGLLSAQPVMLTGEPGEPGRDGKDGAPGQDGATGAAGEQGPKGEPGRDGETGAAGRDGKDGKNGAPGAQGLKGEVGKTGASGAQGPKGEVGKAGENGRKGKDGTSVTDISLEDNTLFVWLDGVRRKIGRIKLPRGGFVPLNGGGGWSRRDDFDFVPWHITENERVEVRPRREMAVHGVLKVDAGARLVVHNSGRLRVTV
jgi:hypothetical protein